jgi:hypothetical protein
LILITLQVIVNKSDAYRVSIVFVDWRNATPERFPMEAGLMGCDIEQCRSWFQFFTKGFLQSDADDADRENIRLKIDHSLRVLDRAFQITAAMDIDEDTKGLAHIGALFHDVGRFPQYMLYRTFVDRQSVNHALLSVDVLRKDGVLRDLPETSRRQILGAIWLHNRFSISSGLSPKLDLLARIIRDADKLDIFFIMVSRLQSDSSTNNTVLFHLKPHPSAYTKTIMVDIRSGRLGRYDEMVWINDFKLLLCSWIYDFNFDISREILSKSGLFESLLSLLPDLPEMVSLKKQLRPLLCIE